MENEGWELTFGEKTWQPAKQTTHEVFVIQEEDYIEGWGKNALKRYIAFLTENSARNYLNDFLNNKNADSAIKTHISPLGWKPVSEHFYVTLKNSLHGKIKIEKLEEMNKEKNV